MPARDDHILHAWVDRARLRRKTAGSVVEGETQLGNTVGTWFKCRVPPQPRLEQLEGGKKTIVDRRQITARLIAEDGTNVVPQHSDLVELETGSTSGAYTPLGVYEIENWRTPRDGAGQDLFLVIGLVRTVEY